MNKVSTTKNRAGVKATATGVIVDEQAIFEILTGALLAGRLAPGLHLGEQQLAALFGVTRERVRKVLHRLGHNRLADLQPNRGIFVAAPGLHEARQVYQARRILEVGVVFHLAGTISDLQIAELVRHLELEQAANDAYDHAEAVRLSGLFHIRLAEMVGNDLILSWMQELVSRTAMLVAYHESGSPQCGCDEHHSILSAIRARDSAKSGREMQLHLSLVETRLQEPPVRPATTDLETILSEEIVRWSAAKRRPGAVAAAASRAKRGLGVGG
jgi:DNA-binding GntR family transcriptional regulator